MDLTTSLLSFAVVAGLMTITPGLDTALVLQQASRFGSRVAMASALGINLGVLVWAVAATLGVSALLATSEVAYTVVRLAGALYMVWLGGRMIWEAVRGEDEAVLPTEGARAVAGRAMTPWAGFRKGFLVNLMNPKIGAFYVALLPQFLPDGVHPVLGGVLLALVHNVEGILWFALIVLAVDRARDLLQRPAVQRGVDAVAGVVVVGFGLRLALSPR